MKNAFMELADFRPSPLDTLAHWKYELEIVSKQNFSEQYLDKVRKKIQRAQEQVLADETIIQCQSVYQDVRCHQNMNNHRLTKGSKERWHNFMGISWTDSGVESKKQVSKTKKQIGDDQEAEIYQRLKRIYTSAVMTNVNAIGVDIQVKPDIDIQSKAFNSVGPKEISHFADSSDAPLKILVALSFTREAKMRAVKRGVRLLTLKDFRKRYPLEGEDA